MDGATDGVKYLLYVYSIISLLKQKCSYAVCFINYLVVVADVEKRRKPLHDEIADEFVKKAGDGINNHARYNQRPPQFDWDQLRDGCTTTF